MADIGQQAPDFRLKASNDSEIALSDYRNQKNVVLVFYPLDFSPVCSNQLPEYSSRKADIEANDSVILGINRDSVYAHKAWAQAFGIDVPLLADMTGEVARSYGVYIEAAAISTRAVFIIDKAGVIRAKHVESAPGEFTYHSDDILKDLAAL